MITLESIKEALSKITPYPWIIERGQKSEETFVSAKKGGRILRIWNGRSAQEANALFIASAPEYVKWLIDRVEELEKCVELANQRAELTNEIMTGATANVNEIRTLKADLAKYKKLEDAAREYFLQADQLIVTDEAHIRPSWIENGWIKIGRTAPYFKAFSGLQVALKEIGEAR